MTQIPYPKPATSTYQLQRHYTKDAERRDRDVAAPCTPPSRTWTTPVGPSLLAGKEVIRRPSSRPEGDQAGRQPRTWRKLAWRNKTTQPDS
jgi:hypothetical protein